MQRKGKREMNWQGIEIEFQRKRVRNFNLAVYPDGRVRLSAPLRAPESEIRRFLADREEWIRCQRQKFGSRPLYREPNLISGEKIPVWGRACQFRLELRPGPGRVEKKGDYLCMAAPPESDPVARRKLLMEWYRSEMYSRVPALLARWQPTVGVQAAEWRVRNMRTRWGSCNVPARRVWLNARLAAWPPECLELVTVHELTHLLVPNHSPRFYVRLESFLPGWRRVQSRLNAPPCG